MTHSIEVMLHRWNEAGLIGLEELERIRNFERGQGAGRDRAVLLAFAAGSVLLIAGVFLFVAAHWDQISAASRFSVVLVVLAAFHGAAVFMKRHSPPLALALHGCGTAALGAGIFLCGQIFHLSAHWAGALALWSLGALVGWWLLRDWLQALWLAMLAPAWLIGAWSERFFMHDYFAELMPPLVFSMLLAHVYLKADTGSLKPTGSARALRMVGLLGLPISALVIATTGRISLYTLADQSALTVALRWAGAMFVPLGLAALMKQPREETLIGLGWALWALFAALASCQQSEALIYLVVGIGAVGLVAEGVRGQRADIVNLGVLGFSVTVVCFYFSNVLDRLDRAIGLIWLGIMFVAGGLAAEKVRRALLQGFARSAS